MNNDIKNIRASFFDEADELFIVIDQQLNYIDVNQVGLGMMSRSREEVIGKNIEDFIPDFKKSPLYRLVVRVFKTGKRSVIEDYSLDSSYGALRVRFTVFKLGEYIAFSIINFNELQESIDDLESFIYNASHDMRSPIVSILGLTNIAASELSTSNPASEYISIIKKQAERMDEILKKSIEAARLRRRELNIKAINFESLISEVKQSLGYLPGFKKMKFIENITVAKPFYNDEAILVSVFQNLIDNAIKYRREQQQESFVNISIQDDNNGIKVVIADNGIGIAAPLQQEVFKMFVRATKKADGTGLGLYSVKQSIRKLSGRIHLESMENSGSIFTFFLPSKGAPEEEEE